MKLLLFTLIAKLISKTIQVLGKGSGNVWPGHIVLTLWPTFFKSISAQFPKGCIVISGTNGKTTTAKLISHLFESNGYNVISNNTGANLLNGIASSILLSKNFLKNTKNSIGVFEVDELTLPKLLSQLVPDVLILLNLSRDQLDRAGEIDIIFEKWLYSLQNLPHDFSLVLDSEQSMFNSFANVFKGKIFYFDSDHYYVDRTRLHGSFNAKNVNAAVTCTKLFGFSDADLLPALDSFEAAYGRGEILEYQRLFLHLFLAKNPASMNNNLEMLIDPSCKVHPDTLFFILNDEIRDGRDISWIYDINPSHLSQACRNRNVFVSGNRCFDMAARLNYAGVPVNQQHVNPDVSVLLDVMAETFNVFEIVALPNYSSMLALRKKITGKEIL